MFRLPLLISAHSSPKSSPEHSRLIKEYCGLFTYRWEWISAPIPDSGNAKPQNTKQQKSKPDWQTHAHPLPDEAIHKALSGKCLIGVSFASNTNYLLADLDRWSMYHPHCNVIEFHRMLSCLEEVGLVRPLIVQSSRSEGLHVYYPIPIAVSSYYLSKTAQHALEEAGFKLSSGQLELFPNAKRYDPDGKTSFRAHRLPLLTGSYLLDPQTLEPYSNALPDFLSAWQICSENQDTDQLITSIAETKERERANRRSRYRGKRSSQGKSNLYHIDHLAWSGGGQTNDLIGYATWHGYAFQGLRTEESLSSWVVEWARNAPGYEEFCDHKYEIERRCRDWARSILSRSYKPRRREGMSSESESDLPPQPLRKGKELHEAVPPNMYTLLNEERVEDARSRIQRGMAELVASGSLPVGVEARLIALRGLVGGSLGTYYKYRELWHPVDLAEAAPQQEKEECGFDQLESSVVKEENPLEKVVNNCIGMRLIDPLYEVMTRRQIDENPASGSVLIPEFRPQFSPPTSPSMPQGRPRLDRRPPIPWSEWAIVTNSPRLTPISPNPADQTPQNPVCSTLPMPIAIKPSSDRCLEREAVPPKRPLFAVPVQHFGVPVQRFAVLAVPAPRPARCALLLLPLFGVPAVPALPLVQPFVRPVQHDGAHTRQVPY